MSILEYFFPLETSRVLERAKENYAQNDFSLAHPQTKILNKQKGRVHDNFDIVVDQSITCKILSLELIKTKAVGEKLNVWRQNIVGTH